MASPSGCSVTSPPSALISLAIAASRSVSCARVWPTPVKLDGPEASAATEVSGRHISGMSRRSASMPLIVPVPVTVSPSAPRETDAPIRVITSRIASAGCSDAAGQSRMVTEPPVTSAAARNGPALDRSGSTVKSPRFSRPGSTRQESGSLAAAPASTVAPASRSIRTVISMCGSEGTGGPECRTATPAVEPRRGQQQAGDELRRPGGIERDRAAAHRARAVDGEGQRAPAAVVDDHAERAQRGKQRAHRPFPGPRVAVERDVGRGAPPPRAGTA